MKREYVRGATLPDFRLPDHTGVARRLSDLQGADPLVLLLGRGVHCPREHQHQREMVQLYHWCQVAYTEMVTITVDDQHGLNVLRNAVGARWPFLSDTDRVVQHELDIQEYTDTTHDPMVPHTIVLAPGLIIDKVYVGYWFWGRPSPQDLWADLRDLNRRIRADFDPTLPEVRSAYDAVQRSASRSSSITVPGVANKPARRQRAAVTR